MGTILTTSVVTKLIRQFGDVYTACTKELMLLLKINLIGYLRIKLMTSNTETYVPTDYYTKVTP